VLCRLNEEPAWSPDGKRVAFVRTIAPLSSVGPPAIVGIFLMNADGTHVKQVTQRKPKSGTEDHAPSWSPDGRRIVFMRVNNTAKPPGASVIYVVNADGTHGSVLRTMPHRWPGAGAPAWSPDGTRILYSTSCWFGDCGQPRTGAQLFTIRPTAPVPISSRTSPETPGQDVGRRTASRSSSHGTLESGRPGTCTPSTRTAPGSAA